MVFGVGYLPASSTQIGSTLEKVLRRQIPLLPLSHFPSQSRGRRGNAFINMYLMEAGGVARLSLRPSTASASAAGPGADALPCVALFLPDRSALRARSTPHGLHQAQKGRQRIIPKSASSSAWWRRGESNPRPKILYSGPLRAFPVVWVSSPGTPAGRVPFGPSREKARLRPPGRRRQAIP